MSQHHRHEWTHQPGAIATEQWRCAECEEVSATCVGIYDNATPHPSAGPVALCVQCQTRLARTLSEIEETWQHDDGGGFHPGMSTVVRTAIAETAGGKLRRTEAGEVPTRESVDERLWWWVALWSEHQGAQNTGAVQYLTTRLLWAARNREASRWREFCREARRLLWRARAVVGTAPARRPESCMHCGGRVVQDWSDKRWNPYPEGLSDVVRCTGCGTEWPDGVAFQRNIKHHVYELPTLHPDRLVTIAQAEVIFPDVPANTWRKWASRDRIEHERSVAESDAWEDRWDAWYEAGNIGPHPQPPEIVERALPECGRDDARRLLYRLGDLHAKADARVDDTRRGRRVG